MIFKCYLGSGQLDGFANDPVVMEKVREYLLSKSDEDFIVIQYDPFYVEGNLDL